MSRLDSAHRLEFLELNDFYQHKFSKPSDWLSCISGFDPSVDAVVSYSILCLADSLPSYPDSFR